MAQAPPVQTNTQEERKKIHLPGDIKSELFVILQASVLAIHNIHTKKVYEAEILRADVNSLSRLSRDTEASYYRRLEADQGLFGDIDEIPSKKIHLRPPNWLVIVAVFFGTMAVIIYGQSNQTLSAQFWYTMTYYGVDIAVLTLFTFAILIWWVLKRRKK